MKQLLPWLVATLALAATGTVIVSALRHEAAANAERQRDAEARELDAAGQIRVVQKSLADMTADRDAAVEWVGALRDALNDARKAAPGAKVIRVTRASTGPVPMNEEAVRAMCAALVPIDATPVEPIIELKGEIHVASVDLRTDKGNLIATGAAEAWQVEPEPKRLLFGGRFTAPATTASELVPPPPEQHWPWYYHEALGLGAGLAAGLLLRQ